MVKNLECIKTFKNTSSLVRVTGTQSSQKNRIVCRHEFYKNGAAEKYRRQKLLPRVLKNKLIEDSLAWELRNLEKADRMVSFWLRDVKYATMEPGLKRFRTIIAETRP